MLHGTRVKIMVQLHNYGTVWQCCIDLTPRIVEGLDAISTRAVENMVNYFPRDSKMKVANCDEQKNMSGRDLPV